MWTLFWTPNSREIGDQANNYFFVTSYYPRETCPRHDRGMGIQAGTKKMDSRFRGNDKKSVHRHFCNVRVKSDLTFSIKGKHMNITIILKISPSASRNDEEFVKNSHLRMETL